MLESTDGEDHLFNDIEGHIEGANADGRGILFDEGHEANGTHSNSNGFGRLPRYADFVEYEKSIGMSHPRPCI